MSYVDLAALYALGGVVSAGIVWRLSHQWGSALLALVLWPLWLPVAFGERGPTWEPPAAPRKRSAADGVAARIAIALDEVRAAAEGTAFEAMLGEQGAARITGEVQRATERLGGLDQVLAQPGFQREVAEARLAELEGHEPTEATLRTARLHLESVERLSAMRDEQARALAELEQVLIALRSQLEVARYAGSMNEGFDAIVADLWSRVEGLGEAFDGREEREEQA